MLTKKTSGLVASAPIMLIVMDLKFCQRKILIVDVTNHSFHLDLGSHSHVWTPRMDWGQT